MTGTAIVTAVLDTNVLFPPTLRDTLLYAASDGVFRLVWSVEILEELRRNLVDIAGLAPATAARRVEWMANTFPQAAVAVMTDAAPALPDPNDRHVLAAAITGRAAVIVTENRKDFPAEVLKPLGIQPVTADAFLSRLLHENPRRMMDTVRHHASQLRNPLMAPATLLEAIALHAPAFARAALAALQDPESGGP